MRGHSHAYARRLLSSTDAYVRVENDLRVWTVYDRTGLVVPDAVRGGREYQISFWDAQIWAVVWLNQIPVGFSEDFHVGVPLDGVRFVNPFDPAFPIKDLV